MVFKAAVVFIAGGLTGSGIVALTRPTDAVQPAASMSEVTTLVSPVQAATDASPASFALLPAQDQSTFIQARFAVQRPFAALHPPQR
jgi:hypothetical protein